MKRPVAARASFTATSTASEPPVVNRHFSRPAGRDRGELLGELERRLARIASRREGKPIHLLGDRPLEARMPIADVVHVVAVEIHVAAPGRVLDPDAFRLDDGVEARRRHGLMQEGARVALEKGAPARVEMLALPASATIGEVGVALRLRDGMRLPAVAPGKLGLCGAHGVKDAILSRAARSKVARP